MRDNNDPPEQDTRNQILGNLLSILEMTKTTLTRPGLADFVTVVVGWLRTLLAPAAGKRVAHLRQAVAGFA